MTIFTFRWHASNGMAYQILVCRILRNFNLCKVCSPFVGGGGGGRFSVFGKNHNCAQM